jgi:hypothetical protein
MEKKLNQFEEEDGIEDEVEQQIEEKLRQQDDMDKNQVIPKFKK